MTGLVAAAERALLEVVEAMEMVLQSTVEDALPQSLLPVELQQMQQDGSSATNRTSQDIPDTLRMRLEWEEKVESERVTHLVAQLEQKRAMLMERIVVLGGADPVTSSEFLHSGQLDRILDVSAVELDQHIAQLASDSSRLGAEMVRLYDEVDAMHTSLENNILSAEVAPC